MGKKTILVLAFFVVVGFAIYYMMNHSEDLLFVDEEADPLGGCYNATSEAPFDLEKLEWGVNSSFSVATTGAIDQAMDDEYVPATISFLKGINVQPTIRTIAMNKDDILKFHSSSIGHIPHWQIEKGEFLCNAQS